MKYGMSVIKTSFLYLVIDIKKEKEEILLNF